MDVVAESLARAIGVRVKQERNGRGWTLDQLAAYAGVSRRMLVNVEQGGVNPSVGTLLRLSDALGVGLPALVEPPAPRVSKVTRRGEGAVLWTGDGGGRGVLVAGTEPPDVVELWDWTLAAGEQHQSEPRRSAVNERELRNVRVGVLVGSLSLRYQADRSQCRQSPDRSCFALLVAKPLHSPLAPAP